MTQTRQGLVGTSLLVAALLAGCAAPPLEETPRPTWAASGSTAATPTPTSEDTALPTGSPPTPDPALRPPVIVPAAVANREALPWCGHEVIERRANGEFFDAGVRECFLGAYRKGEAAEFVSDGPTDEGERYRVFYRSLGDGAVEVYYDYTADHFSPRDWTRVTCAAFARGRVDRAGVPAIVTTECGMPAVIAGPPEDQPSADELVMFHDLVAFAQSRDAGMFTRIPFADEVALGLADEILVRRSGEALEAPSSWVLEPEFFRDRTGPFSALALLAQWDQNAAGMLVRELSMTAGPHPHCASAPVPAPAEFAGLRRVSVQPVGPDTCLLWWTVDLYLTSDGEIAAVTLDLHAQ